MADDYGEFIEKVNEKHDINLSLYKETQMKRRITTLRNKRGFKTFLTYFEAIHKDDILLKEFIERLTINVSEFYRNPKRWEVLNNHVIPLLTENSSRIFIWSAACSTGEEPYSLAMMFREHFPQINVHILATDIDESALEKAGKGIYTHQSLKQLPTKFKEKYFTKIDDLYKIDPSLKKIITFKKHNLLADRYQQNYDLIVCRNVLIYLTAEAKTLIYHRFSKALRDQGILFVGSTEQIFTPNKYNMQLFDSFFYQKQAGTEII